MRCPYCDYEDTQVINSRPAEAGAAVRRRRSCASCGGRVTTFERVQVRELMVTKADDRCEPFDRDKLARSARLALRKRPVTSEQFEVMISEIVRTLEKCGEDQIPSRQIGDLMMQALGERDTVAYVRFASVYRDFSAVEDFEQFVKDLAGKAFRNTDNLY